MGEVALGLPGSWADDNVEASDHYTTKIGGLPDWPFPESSIGRDFLKCSLCCADLCLVTQVYAPVTDASVKIEERVIYVFSCTNSHCGSWRCIRVQKPDNCEDSKIVHPEATPSIVPSAPDSKWLDNLYSFGKESEDNGENEDFNLEDLGRALSEAVSLTSGSVKEETRKHTESNEKPLQVDLKTREVNDGTFVLPCFYVYYEEDKSCQDRAPAFSVKETQVNDDNYDSVQEEVWEQEGYEYDKAPNADRTYLKFKKRLDACPKQCFRYSFGGKPLLATGDVGDAGACGLCGELRHFEMQLMPPLVYFVQEEATARQKDLLDNWSWLTLMVYTCSKSCNQELNQENCNWNSWTVVEESIIAQSE